VANSLNRRKKTPCSVGGASRYYDERYRDAYALECQALLRVRSEMGLTNVIAMIPFCRTPEGRVLAEMAARFGAGQEWAAGL